MRRNYQACRRYKSLLSFVEWVVHNGFYGVIRDDYGKIIALGIARPISYSTDADDQYGVDMDGDTVFVDWAITTRKGLMQALLVLLVRRFGPKDFIAWRPHPDAEIRTYDAERFYSKVFPDITRLIE